MAFPRYDLFPREEQILSAFFRAMGHPVRRRILLDLKTQKMTVSDMVRRYPLSRETLCQHLDILRKAHLVMYREVCPFTLYWRNERQIKRVKELFWKYLYDL